MHKSFSAYLDLTRFLAAVAVVVAHLLQHGFINPTTGYYVPDLGREAVMIFFVLSGYVIAYTSSSKQQSPKQYAIARASRIYSVAIPCMLIAFIAIFSYQQFQGVTLHYQLQKLYLYLPFHSLFLGELWTFTERPPWLTPYWSLSYEVWYYILFGCVFFSKGLTRLLLAGAVFLIMGYKLWLLLPVWFSGVALFSMHKRNTLGPTASIIGWSGSIIVLCVYKYLDIDIYLMELGIAVWPFESLELGSADRYLSDYVVCALVTLNFYCAYHLPFRLLEKNQNLIKHIASYTFTLYLLHFIVLEIWKRTFEHDPYEISHIGFLILCIGIATYITGSLTEHKRHLFTYFFERLFTLVGQLFVPKRR